MKKFRNLISKKLYLSYAQINAINRMISPLIILLYLLYVISLVVISYDFLYLHYLIERTYDDIDYLLKVEGRGDIYVPYTRVQVSLKELYTRIDRNSLYTYLYWGELRDLYAYFDFYKNIAAGGKADDIFSTDF